MNVVTQNINLKDGNSSEKKAEIRQYFIDTWELYEKLFETLKDDSVFFKRPQPLRHPIIFYFGHTATFFINKLLVGKFISTRINAKFESIFAIGVDEMSWDDLNEKNYEWPSIDEVKDYRNRTKTLILDLIDNADIDLPIDWDSLWWTIMMAIEHERIHIETSSVLIRQLPIEDVVESPIFPICKSTGSAPKNSLLDVDGGNVKLGKDNNHPLYSWDNEYGVADFHLAPFKASKYLVSNHEFLEFINDNGYNTDKWWSEEGLSWRDYNSAQFPEFWLKENGKYRLRTMTNIIDLPDNWPAEVCFLEAEAFCKWKSDRDGIEIRLPDEAEYVKLRSFAGITEEHYITPVKANWNLEQFASSTPIDANINGGFGDIVGNVWQWNITPFYGFDGFKVHPLYDDFSVPTFDNRHSMIMGGSWASTGNEISLKCRFAFRRHFYQHAGFRYVQSENEVKEIYDMYETDDIVSQYIEFHYGDDNLGVENFSKAIAEIGINVTDKNRRLKALDIGCSVGRTSFELAKAFKHVDGLDFSTRFIQIGVKLQKSGSIKYERKEEGSLVSLQERYLENIGLKESAKNIDFSQQDANNLKEIYRGYDLVIAANLIDRLREPGHFLDEIGKRMKTGAILLIASPYTWLEDFTPKENWLGGFKRDGEIVTTLDGLHEHLDSSFTLIKEPTKVPFVIRETINKHQYTNSEVTLWQKQ